MADLDQEATEQERDSSGRRTFLKRAGIGAALVWAAPALTTTSSQASAGSAQPGCAVGFQCGEPLPFCDNTKFCDQFNRLACLCANTPTGRRCANTCRPCGSQSCNADADCANVSPNAFCWTTSCCGNLCVVPCGEDYAGGAQVGGADPTAG